jgi:hypothetical protein
MPCRAHAAPMPCRAVALINRSQNGMVMAWRRRGMACVNQTWLHGVNQMGKTQLNPFFAWHGRGKAWEWHGVCELALRISITLSSGNFQLLPIMLLGNMRKLHNYYYCSYYYCYEDFRYVLNLYISCSELISVMTGRLQTSFIIGDQLMPVVLNPVNVRNVSQYS